MVAGAASDALLKDFQEAVGKAIERGTTLADFRKDFDSIVSKHGWTHTGKPGWRARVIYETNLNNAYAAGRYAQMTDPDVLEAYPYWQYVHSGSAHPRLQHLAWDGLTLRADDGFWDAHYPPNGWHCGCRVRPVSHDGLGRMGKRGPDEAPPTQMRTWRNPHTGETHQVPVGIDPGFDWNPGKAWKEGLKDVPLRADPVRPVVPPGGAVQQDLARWLDHPVGTVPVGHMTKEMQKALGTSQDGVMFKDTQLAKQRREHPDLTAADYLRLPDILAQPDLLLWAAKGTVAAVGGGDRMLAVIVKGLPAKDENWVASVFPAWREKTLRGLLARDERIAAERGKIDEPTPRQKAAAKDDDATDN
jgi:hypothetical protein